MSSDKELNKKDNCRNCATCKKCNPKAKFRMIEDETKWASDVIESREIMLTNEYGEIIMADEVGRKQYSRAEWQEVL